MLFILAHTRVWILLSGCYSNGCFQNAVSVLHPTCTCLPRNLQNCIFKLINSMQASICLGERGEGYFGLVLSATASKMDLSRSSTAHSNVAQ